jgi:hypothetical protein
MAERKKVQVGLVYSAKVGGSWLPVRIDKSLGHGRYEGVVMPDGKTVKVATAAIKGDGQSVEAWTAAHAPRADEQRAPAAEGAAKKTAKQRTPKGPRTSLVNAAVLVLADAKDPMNAKAIVELATENGLYAPGDGKTPEATLYSAMLRDKKARFAKADRGLWTLSDAGEAEVAALRQAFDAKKEAK